ncbi:MAG: GNAT family N-acetyltransferase [Bacteroidota bacterium]
MTRITTITAAETWPIRHQVMWPNESIAFVQIPNDEDGLHYGFWLDQRLISVISLFVEGNQAQFRKFATLPTYQGRGFGSQLVHHIIGIAKSKGLTKLWCNARVEKMDYYKKFGMMTTDRFFQKKSIHYVVMERMLT